MIKLFPAQKKYCGCVPARFVHALAVLVFFALFIFVMYVIINWPAVSAWLKKTSKFIVPSLPPHNMHLVSSLILTTYYYHYCYYYLTTCTAKDTLNGAGIGGEL